MLAINNFHLSKQSFYSAAVRIYPFRRSYPYSMKFKLKLIALWASLLLLSGCKAAPVYDPEIKADLKRVVEYGLKDTLQGRVVDGTGENRPWISEDKTAFRSQEELYKYYLNENRIKD